MHRIGSMELKCVGRKAKSDLNDPTSGSMVKTINEVVISLHLPELMKRKKLGYDYALKTIMQITSPCLLKGWCAVFFSG